jgi:hypothetical protein
MLDVRTGKQLIVLEERQHFADALCFSPDGQVLASQSGQDGVTLLWDAAAWTVIGRFTNSKRKAPLSPIAIQPYTHVLANVVDRGRLIRGWKRIASGGMAQSWDVFISHAIEDKDDVARPLYDELKRRGLRVWFDEAELTLGDSLRQKIDEGLAKARFGAVILSHRFFQKAWPQRELDGLVATEDRQKRILPVWHKMKKEEVESYSPMLAGRLATSTSKGIRAVAGEIVRAIRKSTNVQSASEV